ncbi:transcription termination factor nusG family protein [Mycobacterium xenopi 4042]|uniref:Transcription termination factor nusG family protein n=1 Tax=Mycobacterium xenopi 4042 TaxID=1299334 RepID=X7YLK4_MYCXE|nr:transcription termination factor nusG family protein [Mycobacterium xenopi 4042]
MPSGETVDLAEAAEANPDVVADDAVAAEEQGAGEPAEELDPAEALKQELRSKPGKWYVIHSYAGYENKVKANLETRVQNLDVGDYIFQVEVPTEEVTEIKNGQRKQVNRKVLPGYILVRMELTDDSWSAVRNTPGVTGFVGATSRPSPLSLDDVVKFLLPQKAAKRPAKGAAAAAAPAEAGWSGLPSRSTTRSASRSPSWTGRLPRCRPRSARSTPNNRNSRCWCPSSVGRHRWN